MIYATLISSALAIKSLLKAKEEICPYVAVKSIPGYKRGWHARAPWDGDGSFSHYPADGAPDNYTLPENYQEEFGRRMAKLTDEYR